MKGGVSLAAMDRIVQSNSQTVAALLSTMDCIATERYKLDGNNRPKLPTDLLLQSWRSPDAASLLLSTQKCLIIV